MENLLSEPGRFARLFTFRVDLNDEHNRMMGYRVGTVFFPCGVPLQCSTQSDLLSHTVRVGAFGPN